MNSQSFSQTATDTSYVVLPRIIAEEIIRELLQKDRLEKENEILYKQLRVKDELLLNREEIISRLENRIFNLQEINISRQAQLEEFSDLSENLQAQLKRERFSKRLYKASSFAAIIGAGVIIGLR